MCQICQSYHDSMEDLNAHYASDHPTGKEGPQPEMKYNCEVCEKKFAHNSSVRNHMIHAHGITLSKKPRGRKSATQGQFVCSECGQSLAKKNSLKYHLMAIHGWSSEKATEHLH